MQQTTTRRMMRGANRAEHAEDRAADDAARAARLEASRVERQLHRNANRASHRARQQAEQVQRDRMLDARHLLRDLPAPDRGTSKRWFKLVTGREDVGIVPFETERTLRTLDRAIEVALLHPGRAPELAAAITLVFAPVLRSLPILAQVMGGVLVPPLARIAEALDAEPEALGQMLATEVLVEDIEAVRQLLRTRQPVVQPQEPATGSQTSREPATGLQTPQEAHDGR